MATVSNPALASGSRAESARVSVCSALCSALEAQAHSPVVSSAHRGLEQVVRLTTLMMLAAKRALKRVD